MLDPKVQQLLAQLQAQYYNIGKLSSVVATLNVDYLRTELYKRGYNTKLADDGKTVLLVPLGQQTSQ